MKSLSHNQQKFAEALTFQFTKLFQQASYSYVAERSTPQALAETMTSELTQGNNVSIDGEGVKGACKMLAIKRTYKGIREYLNS